MIEKIKLSHDQYNKLSTQERELNQLLLEVDKMEECDIDCQQFRTQIQQLVQRSVNLRNNFGPNSKLSQVK